MTVVLWNSNYRDSEVGSWTSASEGRFLDVCLIDEGQCWTPRHSGVLSPGKLINVHKITFVDICC